MTARTFRRLRERLGTQEEVALMLDVTARTVQRWESGESPVPKMAELALRFLVERHKGRKG